MSDGQNGGEKKRPGWRCSGGDGEWARRMSRPGQNSCRPRKSEMDALLAQCLAAGTHAVPTPTTARRNLETGRSILRTGVAALDRVLRGGFPCRSVSEVCGEAGSGKTQLLLQLLVRSQMSTEHGGLGRKAVYICTEGEPPTTRLVQIANEHVGAYPDAFARGDPLDHIMIEKVHSPAELEQLIEIRLPAFLDRMPVGIIVLDSIAAPMRGDESYSAVGDSASRAALLIKLASLLKMHASRNNCAVVVANQVSDVIGPDEHAKVDEASNKGGERRGFGSSNGQAQRKEGKVAAMGLAWAQAINSRLVLQRCRPRCLVDDRRQGVGGRDAAAGASDMEHLEPVGMRQAHLVMSPWAPASSCRYRIGSRGILALEEEEAATPMMKTPATERTDCFPEALREGDSTDHHRSYGRPPPLSKSEL